MKNASSNLVPLLMNEILAASQDGKPFTDLQDAQYYLDRFREFPQGSVYDVVQVINGIMLDPERHFRRIRRSVELTEIDPPHPLETVEEWSRELVMSIKNPLFLLLIAVTPEHTVIIAFPLDFDPFDEQRCFRVITVDCERPQPEAKSFQARRVAAHALKQGLDKGYDEALIVNRSGQIAEGAVTSLFWEKNGVLYTSVKQALHGTTQQIIIDLCRQSGIQVRTDELLQREDLHDIEALAITNVRIGFRYVTEIEGQPISITPLFRKVFQLFTQYLRQKCYP